MGGAIKYNLSHLLDFSGRDARGTFWYYVLFLFLLNMAVSVVLGLVLAGSIVGTVVDAARAGASEDAVRLQMGVWMGGFISSIMWYSLASNAIMILLLAASFVRRLHDSNKPGWWGLLVLAAQAAGSFVSIRMMDVMQDVMAQAMSRTTPMSPLEMQGLMQSHNISAYSAIGWIGPLAVIVFGVLDSTNGPNRYGDEPVRF